MVHINFYLYYVAYISILHSHLYILHVNLKKKCCLMSHRSPLPNAEKFQLPAMLLSGCWNDKNIFMMNAMASDLDTRLKNKTFNFFSFA